jgi:hypothetical protein
VRVAKAPITARPKSRLARLRPIIIGALALFLVWAIVTKGVSAYLAEINPEAALWLQSTQPVALTKLADEKLNPRPAARNEPDSASAAASTEEATDDQRAPPENPLGSGHVAGEDLNQVKAWAELALRNDPLNARALRILGQVALLQSDENRANTLMQASASHSRHDGYANYWTMARNYQTGDYPAALHYADVLLRTRHNMQPHVMPLLTKLAESPETSPLVKELLTKNPPWRSQFLAYLPGGISDARTPLEILLSLKNSSTPPTPSELRPYLDFLVQREFYELAYDTWLQFLPPEQLTKVGRLFNGNFQTASLGAPFDWVFSEGQGVTIQLSERPDQPGDNALLLEFGPGRVEFGGVTQMVLLPAGDYHLSGRYKSDLLSQRGLVWRISCASKTLGESFPVRGSDPAWKDFKILFTVPEDGCAAQNVTLALDARSASETFVSGSIWYDDLRIRADQRTQIDDPSPSIDVETQGQLAE